MLIFVSAGPVFAQSWSFSDPSVDYSFDLPEAKWKLTVKPTAASPKSEFVYGDRRDGLLEVRQITVAKDASMTDIINDDEQKHRQFLPGYVTGKIETFAGRLRGAVSNFEYVAGGRNMSGRYYFLRSGDTTVYVLRFSGEKDELRPLRTQTDQIARSFRVK
jgi:hypothetical protein